MNLTPKQTIKGTVAVTQSLRGSIKDIPSLDNTLTKEGYAADAKAVGEALNTKAPISHTEDKGNPHGVTASQVGARPDTWMPSASEIGARPDTWMPTANDVGARPNTWMPTASEVGAATPDHVKKASPFNLLDNSDFRNPVNQRGFTSGSVATNAYFIDRWKAWNATHISTINTNGLQVASGTIRQDLTSELTAVLVGKRITFAAKIDGTVCVCHATVSQPGVYTQLAVNAPLEIAVSSTGELICAIKTSSASTIEWATLYEGEYTEETLPEYHPKGYGVELAECQRYYYQLKSFDCYGYGFSYGDVAYTLILPTEMRIASPTVTYGECIAKCEAENISDQINRIDIEKHKSRIRFSFITLQANYKNKVMFARLSDICISADL